MRQFGYLQESFRKFVTFFLSKLLINLRENIGTESARCVGLSGSDFEHPNIETAGSQDTRISRANQSL